MIIRVWGSKMPACGRGLGGPRFRSRRDSITSCITSLAVAGIESVRPPPPSPSDCRNSACWCTWWLLCCQQLLCAEPGTDRKSDSRSADECIGSESGGVGGVPGTLKAGVCIGSESGVGGVPGTLKAFRVPSAGSCCCPPTLAWRSTC